MIKLLVISAQNSPCLEVYTKRYDHSGSLVEHGEESLDILDIAVVHYQLLFLLFTEYMKALYMKMQLKLHELRTYFSNNLFVLQGSQKRE